MPVRVTAEQATEQWVNRLQSSTQRISDGIDRVSEAPGRKAVAKADKWHQNVTQAKDKWARNTGRVSLEEWKAAIKDVGLARIGPGAQAKRGKMLAFQQEFLPFLQQGVSRVEQMPDTSFDQRVNRAVEMMRHNHRFQRRG